MRVHLYCTSWVLFGLEKQASRKQQRSRTVKKESSKEAEKQRSKEAGKGRKVEKQRSREKEIKNMPKMEKTPVQIYTAYNSPQKVP